MIKRIYSRYQDWEDFQNGMYSNDFSNLDADLKNAFKILSNSDYFYKKGLEMILSWPVCADYNLSNKSINRKAWIGQATCCYVSKVPEVVTKISWGLLSENEQIMANYKAKLIIDVYEKKYIELYQNMGTKMLF